MKNEILKRIIENKNIFSEEEIEKIKKDDIYLKLYCLGFLDGQC